MKSFFKYGTCFVINIRQNCIKLWYMYNEVHSKKNNTFFGGPAKTIFWESWLRNLTFCLNL